MSDLGFCDIPDVEYTKLFVVAREDGYPWGFSREKPCTQKAIKSQIKGVKIIKSEYKGEEQEKLEVAIQADRKYLLVSGFNTVFSRGLLLGLLAYFNSAESGEPIIISPQLSDNDGKVVFCNLYCGQQRIRYEWNKEADPESLVQSLQKFLRSAPQAPQAETAVSSVQKSSPPTTDWNELVAETSDLMKRLGWTIERGREFLLEKYNKRSRQQLTDAEFLGFLNYLRQAIAGHPAPRWVPIDDINQVFSGENDDSIPF